MYLELVGINNHLSGAIVNVHCTLGETILFFKLPIHQEDRFAKLFRAFLESLFKQISCSLELVTTL